MWSFVTGFSHLHSVFKVHFIAACIYVSLLFVAELIFQCVTTPHFINSFIKLWTFGCFSFQGYFEYCCYEHSCASSCVGIHTHFSWVHIFWGEGAMLGLGCSTWDLVSFFHVWGGSSFLNRGQTQAPALGACVLATGPPGKSHLEYLGVEWLGQIVALATF